MSKRFTDTDKWLNNKWFYELTPELKLFWIYLLDNCDNVGVWEENIKLASILIGYTYPLDTLLKSFEKQIHIFKEGRKWWIVDFCDFQYGKFDEDSTSKPIQSYIKNLKDHGLWIPYTKGIHTLKEKEKDKDKDKVKEKVKEKPEKTLLIPWDSEKFRLTWEAWKQYKREEFRFKYKGIISEQAALNNLANLSNGNEDTAIKIIVQSMANAWKGFFKLKTDEPSLFEENQKAKDLIDKIYGNKT